MAQVLVLGAGFGGLAAAHELRRSLPSGDQVTIVAASTEFYVGFAKLWDLAGVRPLAEGTRRLDALERHGIRYLNARITGIDAATRTVTTTDGTLTADGIVVALGAGYAPKSTALLGEGTKAHNLYDARSLPAIHAALDELTEGTVHVGILGAPYLCPPAPFEAALMVDEWLAANGRGDAVRVVVSTPAPLTLPVAGPDASRYLADQLTERGVTVLTEHPITEIDQSAGVTRFAEGRELDWDLMLGVPAAAPPAVLADSGLAAQSGWIEPDRYTFATTAERVYAVGDCTLVPTATAQLPKAGVFAEAEGTIAARNLLADLYGGEPTRFDGHGFCFLELPDRQVARVAGDFYAEPKPDVQLTSADSASYTAKQQWERERLDAWLG